MSVATKNAPLSTSLTFWPVFYLMLALGLALFIFSDGLGYMLQDWQREEYSHGYIIPLISLFMLLQKIPELEKITVTKPWVGIPILLLGIFFYALGELSALYSIIQYGFIFVIVGAIISLFGTQCVKILSAPLFYLIFMIPLPDFLYLNLSSHLQLLSSAIGVFILHLFNISVYLEGNIIDLGNLRLQVVDACSGLRYLFPLMSFGFLVVYFYRAPVWKKTILFLSTIPITIFMNSFRIAVIGVTVDIWGVAAAEGFIHDFEGWVVFIACLGCLSLEILILHRITGDKTSPLDNLSISLPSPIFSLSSFRPAFNIKPVAVIALAILLAAISLKFIIAHRSEAAPSRQELSQMPLVLGSWKGKESHLEKDVITALKFNDYFLADYRNENSNVTLNLYIAYYASQRKGASVHSPKTCMPGGGWELSGQQTLNFENILATPQASLTVNKVQIQKANTKNIVFYWFQQRGRIITNEYQAKWLIFWDAITRNRTDGALVRVIASYSDESSKKIAEEEMQHFVAQLAPILPTYLPE